MSDGATIDYAVRQAYGERAGEYIQLLGDISHTAAEDRARISTWASDIPGLIVDAGSGPGLWTEFLRSEGRRVIGVDLTPEFVDAARSRCPEAEFRVGDLRALDFAEGSVGGILAWYSLIHVAPRELPAVFAELARVIAPGGRLLIGFFDGPEEEPFPHGVVTAYFWTITALEDLLIDAGFTVVDFETRRDEGRRPHGSIAAVRTG